MNNGKQRWKYFFLTGPGEVQRGGGLGKAGLLTSYLFHVLRVSVPPLQNVTIVSHKLPGIDWPEQRSAPWMEKGSHEILFLLPTPAEISRSLKRIFESVSAKEVPFL